MKTFKEDLENSYDSQLEFMDKERIRIAQLLHGEVQQIFGSAQRDFLKRLSTPDQRLFSRRMEMGQKVLDDLVYELYPPVLQNIGLVPAVEQYVLKLNESKDLAIRFKSVEIPRIAEDIRLVLFRIIQKSLSLIMVPPNANDIDLSFALDGGTKLLIRLSRKWIGEFPFQDSNAMTYLRHSAKRIKAKLSVSPETEPTVVFICQLQLRETL